MVAERSVLTNVSKANGPRTVIDTFCVARNGSHVAGRHEAAHQLGGPARHRVGAHRHAGGRGGDRESVSSLAGTMLNISQLLNRKPEKLIL